MQSLKADTTNGIPLRQYTLLMTIREGLLLILGALEDYLGLPRTKEARKR